MKAFAILICAMVTLHVDAITLAEHKTMVIGIAQECKITENASDGDIGRLVEKKAPDTKEGICLFTCIIEQMDVVILATEKHAIFY